MLEKVRRSNLNDLVANRYRDCVSPVCRAEFPHRCLDVFVDRSLGDVQDLADRCRGLATRHPPQYLTLAR